MPRKDPEAQRRYGAEWARAKRASLTPEQRAEKNRRERERRAAALADPVTGPLIRARHAERERMRRKEDPDRQRRANRKYWETHQNELMERRRADEADKAYRRELARKYYAERREEILTELTERRSIDPEWAAKRDARGLLRKAGWVGPSNELLVEAKARQLLLLRAIKEARR